MNVLYPARVGRSGPFRPSIQPTGVAGLNICGDYTYPGGAGYGCALKSARDVLNQIEAAA
jgi:phytoene dehydrogenase-like protein